jgi:hypothetical protein
MSARPLTHAGLHKDMCKHVEFPNAEVMNVASFYPRLTQCVGGEDSIKNTGHPKNLRSRLI